MVVQKTLRNCLEFAGWMEERLGERTWDAGDEGNYKLLNTWVGTYPYYIRTCLPYPLRYPANPDRHLQSVPTQVDTYQSHLLALPVHVPTTVDSNSILAWN